jgi:hypothetical protein
MEANGPGKAGTLLLRRLAWTWACLTLGIVTFATVATYCNTRTGDLRLTLAAAWLAACALWGALLSIRWPRDRRSIPASAPSIDPIERGYVVRMPSRRAVALAASVAMVAATAILRYSGDSGGMRPVERDSGGTSLIGEYADLNDLDGGGRNAGGVPVYGLVVPEPASARLLVGGIATVACLSLARIAFTRYQKRHVI